MDAKIITGRVVKVINDYNVVINKGTQDGVMIGQRYLIYREDEEIIDPETKESLGKLELVCGKGVVTHVQEKMSTLTTYEKKKREPTAIVRKTYGSVINGLAWMRPAGEVEEKYNYGDEGEMDVPFDNVDDSCFARRISNNS